MISSLASLPWDTTDGKTVFREDAGNPHARVTKLAVNAMNKMASRVALRNENMRRHVEANNARAAAAAERRLARAAAHQQENASRAAAAQQRRAAKKAA